MKYVLIVVAAVTAAVLVHAAEAQHLQHQEVTSAR